MIILLVPILALVILVICGLTYELIYKQKRIYDIFKQQNIPGDPFVPLIGHLARFSKDDQILDVRRRQQEKHGNIYLLSFGHRVNLVLVDINYIADVLTKYAKYYQKPELFRTLFGPLIGGTKNLFASEGKQHTRLRKMLNPAFKHSEWQSMVAVINEQTTMFVDSLLEDISKDDFAIFDLHEVFQKLTLSIIVSSIFGQEIFEKKVNGKEILCNAYRNATKAIEYRSIYMINQIPFVKELSLWKKDILDNETRIIGKFVEECIMHYQQKRDILPESLDRSDILGVLLSATDLEGVGLNNDELKQEALAFLFAGHEASNDLMSWCLYILMTNGNVYQDCLDEIDRVLKYGQPLDLSKLNELEILDAVLHETLRLYPPLPTIRRVCIQDHYIGPADRQLRIPKGTSINIDVYGVHRLSEYWPDPLTFNYRRWMGDDKEKHLSNSYYFLPFSGGNRKCIGKSFALLEAKIMLVVLLQRLNFELVNDKQIVPDVKLTMKPKNGLLTKITSKFAFKN